MKTTIKIEAANLQDAYMVAARELGCSAADVNISVLTAPRAGFLGFFKKKGLFEASANVKKPREHKENKFENRESKNCQNEVKSERVVKDFRKNKKPREECEIKFEKQVAHESEPKLEKTDALTAEAFKFEDNEPESFKFETPKPVCDELQAQASEPKVEEKPASIAAPKVEIPHRASAFEAYDSIVDNFNKADFVEPANHKIAATITESVLTEIREGLERLLDASAFAISVSEVSKYDDKTVFVKLDGEDCALLIGKEGYRYKAISYMLFNWINAKYGLGIRLEIAEFLKNQENAVSMYLASVIQKIELAGRGHTKPLDGVLVKIALEQLRARFPNKYVGIKNSDEGRYVVVNDFFKK